MISVGISIFFFFFHDETDAVGAEKEAVSPVLPIPRCYCQPPSRLSVHLARFVIPNFNGQSNF
jgi:hypothetical protein